MESSHTEGSASGQGILGKGLRLPPEVRSQIFASTPGSIKDSERLDFGRPRTVC
jgi:hypothetical protein